MAEEFSDLAHLITENQVGKCFTREDIDGMVTYVKLIKAGKANEYKVNALKVSKKFTNDNALEFLRYSYS
jgi:hypothetical protein